MRSVSVFPGYRNAPELTVHHKVQATGFQPVSFSFKMRWWRCRGWTTGTEVIRCFSPTRTTTFGWSRIDASFSRRVSGLSVRNTQPTGFSRWLLSAAAFDEEGFYRIGDAGYHVDEARPERGVMFDGRVAEDFKLSSGTWVSVGTLRLKLVSAFSPFARDVVITGHERDQIGALVFPSAACSELTPEVCSAKIGAVLGALRNEGGGSSQTPFRAMILTEPPNADAGEITDRLSEPARDAHAARGGSRTALQRGTAPACDSCCESLNLQPDGDDT